MINSIVYQINIELGLLGFKKGAGYVESRDEFRLRSEIAL